MESITATLIYLDSCILISKKNYQDWREMQSEYWDTYKTSLSPMTCEEIICFFGEDFGEESHWPFSNTEIVIFFESDATMIKSAELDR